MLKMKFSLMKVIISMKKLIALSSKEALVIYSALCHWAYHCGIDLNSDNLDLSESALDELDKVDYIRRKLSKAFPDLSLID